MKTKSEILSFVSLLEEELKREKQKHTINVLVNPIRHDHTKTRSDIQSLKDTERLLVFVNGFRIQAKPYKDSDLLSYCDLTHVFDKQVKSGRDVSKCDLHKKVHESIDLRMKKFLDD